MQAIIHTFAIVLSLVTATGVFVHDAKIDKVGSASKLAVQASHRSKLSVTDGMTAAEPHTHPQRASNTLQGFAYQTPTYPPREKQLKRYLLQNIEPRGRHAFDNYNLPIVA